MGPRVMLPYLLSSGSLFLVRESQRNPQGFVLSLCHLQKVKHYLILPVSFPASPEACNETQDSQQPVLLTRPRQRRPGP